MKRFDFDHILLNFGFSPAAVRLSEFNKGHINDSYIIDSGQSCRLFLQRINHHVFRDPEGLMENLILVDAAMTRYYGDRESNPYPRVLPNRNKKFFHIDPDGNYWRLMEFVPDSISFDIAENADIAREGAAAFGKFQVAMNRENASAYVPTIPDFHHLGKRMRQLQDAIGKDTAGRVAACRTEITFALDRAEYAVMLEKLLREKVVPMRVTHNDTKLNNVLFNKESGKHICVVDLDTVMPGTVLYDYGDMVRTFTSPVAEDEPDPGKVVFRKDIFEALTRGYLSELKDSLVQGEKDNLLFGGKIMLLMIGVRFLTDYLEGDHYFKTSREHHNLERCRNQFTLLQQLENEEYELKNIIRSSLK